LIFRRGNLRIFFDIWQIINLDSSDSVIAAASILKTVVKQSWRITRKIVSTTTAMILPNLAICRFLSSVISVEKTEHSRARKKASATQIIVAALQDPSAALVVWISTF
jgi:hypothetical protein